MTSKYVCKIKYKKAKLNLPKRFLRLNKPSAKRFEKSFIVFRLEKELKFLDGTPLADYHRFKYKRDNDDDTRSEDIQNDIEQVKKQIETFFTVSSSAGNKEQRKISRERG